MTTESTAAPPPTTYGLPFTPSPGESDTSVQDQPAAFRGIPQPGQRIDLAKMAAPMAAAAVMPVSAVLSNSIDMLMNSESDMTDVEADELFDTEHWGNWVQNLLNDIGPADTPRKRAAVHHSVAVPPNKKPAIDIVPILEQHSGIHHQQPSQSSATGRERRGRRAAAVNAMQEIRETREFTGVNNDYCDFCHQSGEFVCCEGCPRSFHYACADPPLTHQELETMDHWYCNLCRRKREPVDLAAIAVQQEPAYNNPLFGQLLQSMDQMNPVAFALPDDIKKLFAGVSYNPATGDYIDKNESGPVKPYPYSLNSLSDSPWSPSRPSLIDYEQTKLDESGNPMLCHMCRRSGLRGPMIQCDFCPLAWHLDCLDPPMTCPPPMTKRWMCPAHADLLKPRRKVARNAHHIVITDPEQNNDGDIDVILSTDFETSGFDRRRRIQYKVPEQAIRIAFFDKLHDIYSDADDASMVEDQSNDTMTMSVESSTQPAQPVGTWTRAGSAGVTAPATVLSSYGPADKHLGKVQVAKQATSRTQPPNKSVAGSYEIGYHPVTVTPDEARTWLSGLSRMYEDIAEFLHSEVVAAVESKTGEDGMVESSGASNPFATETDLDRLVRIATGDVSVIDQQLTDAEGTGPSDARSDASVAVQKKDPLYMQFLAWKQMMKLKHAQSHTAAAALHLGPQEHDQDTAHQHETSSDSTISPPSSTPVAE